MKPYLKITLRDESGVVNVNDLTVSIDTLIADRIDYSRYPSEHLLLNVKKGYQLKMGDKFYFCPGVAVPRVKLKDLASSHKARTVRDIDAATVIFIGNKTYDQLTDIEWKNYVETDLLKKFVDDAHAAGEMNDYYYDKFMTAMEFYTLDDVMIDYPTSRILNNASSYDYAFSSNLLSNGSVRTLVVKDEHTDLYMELIERPVYMEDELYPYLNGPDATVIDENMYDTLREMFRSSDNDNKVLAMEIMANCDWDNSIMYLCFLMQEFANQIYNQKSKSHVNFKSVLSYLGKSPTNIHMDKDEIFDVIIRKKLLTKEIAQTILSKYVEETLYGNSKYFKIKCVSLSEEIDKILNEEITLDTKSLSTEDDY